MSGMPTVRSFASFLLACLLLAPGAARAVNDCGAPSGAAFTGDCTAAAYATGIVYWDQPRSVTLTVPGTATTTTITAAANNGLHNGITIRTNDHATQTHNIALTVGSAAGAVAIAQSGTRPSSWYNNRGILVMQRDGGGATTTVDVKSGVTIGTQADKMENGGIEVRSMDSGGGAVIVTSAATIWSEADGQRASGIHVDNAGSGATMLTNSGAVTSDGRGIHVLDSGSAGAVMVTSSGAVAAGAGGIYAGTTGKDAAGANAGVTVTHSAGAVAATDGRGIEAHVGAPRQETDTAHDDYVTPRNAGLAKVQVTGGSVRSKWTSVRAFNYEAGSVEVDVSEGVTLTSTDGTAVHAEVADAGNAAGTVSVTQAGTIRAAGAGIGAIRTGGSGAVTVTNSGAVTAGSDGIFVVARGGGGTVSVANSGAIGAAGSPAARGIFVSHNGAGAAGGVTVANSGAITATDHGILAQTVGQDAAGANVGVTVTHSAGAVVVTSDEATDDGSQGVKEGIVVRVGNWRQETDSGHDRYVAPVNAGLARAAVTGGSVNAKGIAVEVANYEAGGVEIDVSAGVELTSTHDHGVEADLRDVGNKRGTIEIAQAGTISAPKSGLRAKVAWNGGAGPNRAIDVTWTGTFRSLPTPTAAPLANVVRALEAARTQAVNALGFRHTAGYAGIDAGVMKLGPAMRVVAAGDDPGAIADAAAQTNLLSETHADSRRAAILEAFKAAGSGIPAAVLGAIKSGATSLADVTDAEIVAYLGEDDAARRTLLRNVLALSFTAEETKVFQALLRGGDVNAALDAVTGAADAWKRDVRALVGNHNTGDVRIAMNAGSIDSRGYGIRAWYAKPHDMNGRIEVTVAAGATVEGDVAGIYVANAGLGLRIAKKYTPPDVHDAEANRNLEPDDLVTLPKYRNQVVRVDGTVTGGSDAAVHLDGGGALIVGKTGKLVAGSSGEAVLVNDPAPAVIYIDGDAAGGEGAAAAVDLTGGGSVVVGLNGRVRANGADKAIRLGRPAGDDTPTEVVLLVERGRAARFTDENVRAAAMRIAGGVTVTASGAGVVKDRARVVEVTTVNGRQVATGFELDEGAPLDAEGNPTPPAGLPTERFNCELAKDRCRLYEALPSALLAMNDLPSRAERMSAARDGAGGWALVEAAGGRWTAAGPAAGTAQDKLTYRHSRFGVRMGADVAAGEDAVLGLSAHGFRGSAKTAPSGTAKLSGVGFGVYAAATFDDEVYIDAQAASTWYDVDVDTPNARKDDARGRGHAAALELGRRVAVSDDMTVVPRAALLWSSATLGSFEEAIKNDAGTPGATVSVRGANGLAARIGMGVESAVADGARLFGSLDVSQELSSKTEAMVSGTTLRSSARRTSVEAGIGGRIDLGDGASLQGSATYALGGRGNNEFGGGLSLDVSF